MNNLQDLLDKIAKMEIADPKRLRKIEAGMKNAKPLYVFHNGVLVETCRSLTDATTKYGCGVTHKVLRKYEDKDGYYFSYTNIFNPKDKPSNITHQNEVQVFDISGTPLGIFPSVAEASRVYGLSSSTAVAVCNGKRKQTKGYVLKYTENTPLQPTENSVVAL